MIDKKIFITASSLLGPNGEMWIKGAPEWQGKYCLGGAVAKAITGDSDDMYAGVDEYMEYLAYIIAEYRGYVEYELDEEDSFVDVVWQFNDASSFNNIKAVLEKAAQ